MTDLHKIPVKAQRWTVDPLDSEDLGEAEDLTILISSEAETVWFELPDAEDEYLSIELMDLLGAIARSQKGPPKPDEDPT